MSVEDDACDAARWRALMASQRMTLMGWTGFDRDLEPRKLLANHTSMPLLSAMHR